MNEMRLVEVAARRCNICPIGRGTVSRKVNGLLKTLHTTEQLRRDADLIGKYLDKMPLAQPEMRGKVSNLRFARIPSEDVQGGPNCSIYFQPVLQTSDERPFQNAEAPGWIRSRAELFAQILCRPSPKRFQIHMNIGEFACGNAQEAKRAAGLEMHAQNALPRIDEHRPRICPGKECASKSFVAPRLLRVIDS